MICKATLSEIRDITEALSPNCSLSFVPCKNTSSCWYSVQQFHEVVAFVLLRWRVEHSSRVWQAEGTQQGLAASSVSGLWLCECALSRFTLTLSHAAEPEQRLSSCSVSFLFLDNSFHVSTTHTHTLGCLQCLFPRLSGEAVFYQVHGSASEKPWMYLQISGFDWLGLLPVTVCPSTQTHRTLKMIVFGFYVTSILIALQLYLQELLWLLPIISNTVALSPTEKHHFMKASFLSFHDVTRCVGAGGADSAVWLLHDFKAFPGLTVWKNKTRWVCKSKVWLIMDAVVLLAGLCHK